MANYGPEAVQTLPKQIPLNKGVRICGMRGQERRKVGVSKSDKYFASGGTGVQSEVLGETDRGLI